MLLSIFVSLMLFSFPWRESCANVPGLHMFFFQAPASVKKPSPRPTPVDGPRGGTGGASRTERDYGVPISDGTGERAGSPSLKPSKKAGRSTPFGVGERTGSIEGRSSSGGRRGYISARPKGSKSFDICDPTEHQEEDLSGTYSGVIKFPSRKVSGLATLTIEGRKFKLVGDNLMLSGRLSSETTCDYTAVAIRFETESVQNASSIANESISLEAERIGSNLSLISIAGQPEFEFTPTSKASSRRRSRD